MRMLELKVPPPLVFAVLAAAMYLLAKSLPELAFALPARGVFAALPLLGGAAIGVAGFLAFRRAGTTVDPLHPQAARRLVTAGVYRHTRNPMYLGLLLGLVAWAVWLANLAACAVPPLLVLYLGRFQIAPEERALEGRFGAEFVAYRNTVRRWL